MSSTTSSTAASTADSARNNNDRLFGAGGYDRLNAAMGQLATNPAYVHAGLALGHVMNSVAQKDPASLTEVDKGALRHAIVQMQSLVGARAVSPAQAGILNGAIWNLQGALR